MRQRAEELLEQTSIKVLTSINGLCRCRVGGGNALLNSRAAGWGSKLIIMDRPTAALGIQGDDGVENIIRGAEGTRSNGDPRLTQSEAGIQPRR